jgi:hypothetical protein
MNAWAVLSLDKTKDVCLFSPLIKVLLYKKKIIIKLCDGYFFSQIWRGHIVGGSSIYSIPVRRKDKDS